MPEIQVKTGATRQAAASILRDLILGTPVVLERVVEEAAANARNRPEYYTPRHGMAGLQGATRAGLIEASSRRCIAEIRNDKPYAIAVHQGSRPHPIVARHAPFLVFFWPKVGHWVRTKAVRHPGNKSMPFLETPRRFGEQRLTIALQDLLANVTRRYCK